MTCCNIWRVERQERAGFESLGLRGQQLRGPLNLMSSNHTRGSSIPTKATQNPEVSPFCLSQRSQPKKITRYTKKIWSLYIYTACSTTKFAPRKWDSFVWPQRSLNDLDINTQVPNHLQLVHCAKNISKPKPPTATEPVAWALYNFFFQPFLDFVSFASAVHWSNLQASFFVTRLAGRGWNVIFHQVFLEDAHRLCINGTIHFIDPAIQNGHIILTALKRWVIVGSCIQEFHTTARSFQNLGEELKSLHEILSTYT